MNILFNGIPELITQEKVKRIITLLFNMVLKLDVVTLHYSIDNPYAQ